ncbi:MAG: hypothetical protein AABO58_17615 [Acidobacteriota bacterium]
MSLNTRKWLQIEVPDFLIRSLQQRVIEANRDAPPGEEVEIDDVIEWYLAAPITVADVPRLEAAIPGFADALSAWLTTVTYDPQ